jgi:hypothetical protein
MDDGVTANGSLRRRGHYGERIDSYYRKGEMTSIIAPAYNEALHIEAALQVICKVFSADYF